MGYRFGADYDLNPLMDAFGIEFELSAGDATTMLTGVLDTEWVESDTGGSPTMQQVAKILIRTGDVRDAGEVVRPGARMYRDTYEYIIREVLAEYGGLTAVICQVCHAPELP